MPSYTALYRRWLTLATADPDLHTELLAIASDPAAIEDRFYRELDFGTAGIRGVIGAGTNRINVYTVARTTQGMAAWLRAQSEAPSVAIAYDSRNKSTLFAQTAARVFAANGVRAHLYPQLMPTPALSFAVRHLRCDGGVMVTASHNPAIYNGYKAYGPDGSQLADRAAAEVTEAIHAVDAFDGVAILPYDEGVASGMISLIGEDVNAAYLAAVAGQSLLPADTPRDVSIVYTPLNGAGISCVPDCLTQHGFTRITIPEAQKNPDGNFPTCPFPNPELREALEVGLDCAAKVGADLLLATDPDCDRVGIAVRDGEDYTLLTGNQTGVLLLDFICKMRTQRGDMPEKPVAVTTIVTTPLAGKIAQSYGAEMREVLTGFKYIGQQIAQLEARGEEGRFLFGFEESYGYLAGTYVRDKDAVVASLLICEMFAYYRAQGKTLVAVLDALYEKHGAYVERVESFEFAGATGFSRMQGIMASFRETPPKEIAGQAVSAFTDYNDSAATGLPAADVLRFGLSDGSSVMIRPSGTEPKLKLYFFAHEKTRKQSEETVIQIQKALDTLLRD